MGSLSTLMINRLWGEDKKWSYLTALNGTLTGKLKKNCLKKDNFLSYL